MAELKAKCKGSQSFPTSYNGEFTRCQYCKRKMKLHVNGRLPNHNERASS